MGYDFEGLNQILISRAPGILMEWLPGGRMRGAEYVCGNLKGGEGESCSVNVKSGKWGDFATGETGGDLISLYAAIYGHSQGAAFRELSERYGNGALTRTPTVSRPREPVAPAPEKPPADAPIPECIYYLHGGPSMRWCYRNADGEPLFYTARYELKAGGKDVIPWSWIGNEWKPKSWPAPRPLYGLDRLAKRPGSPVLLVEGEKTCDAAQALVGERYVAVTWSGGAKAWRKTDFSPVYGRSILLWPDADADGVDAGNGIAEHLAPHCKEIKIISTEGLPQKYDAADFTGVWGDFVPWAKSRVSVYEQPKLEPVVLPAEADEPPENEAPMPDDADIAVTDEQRDVCNELQLMRNKLGAPYKDVANVVKALANSKQFQKAVWYDDFHNRIFTTVGGGKVREWTEVDTINFQIFLQEVVGLRDVGKDKVHDGLITYARRNTRNEPRDWMMSLKWDGTERVDTFFSYRMGSPVSELSCSISRNFWLSMAARILSPGCKVDTMCVLIGAQGAFKSTALSIIGGKWYSDIQESVRNHRDFCLSLQGKMLCEISELGSFAKSEESAIKATISRQVDRFRVPYGHRDEDFPRHSVFCGTTNNIDFLGDPTGGRRFYPVMVGKIDLEGIAEDREQLFAEAVARFLKGEVWYKVPLDDIRLVHEQHYAVDVWEELIEDWLIGKIEVSMSEILANCIEARRADMTEPSAKRVGKIMRRLGWEKTVVRGNGGARLSKCWRKVDATPLPNLSLVTPNN